MFTVYTDYEIIEFDELLEAIEYCEETQCGSSGNAEIMLVDETGNELCQIDGSIKQLSLFLLLTNADTYGIMKAQRKGNKMNKNKAKLELFKVNRNIEKMIVAHANELGQWNKNCLMNDLQRLWDRKKTLQNTING